MNSLSMKLYVGASVGIVVVCMLCAKPPNSKSTTPPEMHDFVLDSKLIEQRAALERKHRHILERIAMKSKIVTDLVEGRMSFLEAVHLFQELNSEESTYDFVLELNYPGMSSEERNARSLLNHVERHEMPEHQRLCTLEFLKTQFEHHFQYTAE